MQKNEQTAQAKRSGSSRNSNVKNLLVLIVALAVIQSVWRKGVVTFKQHNVSILKSNALTQEKPILYVHFHKSGGTTACWIMSSTRKGRTNNCNVAPIGPSFDVVAHKENQNCKHIESYATANPKRGFLAIEVPLTEPLPCNGESFRSMAVMREPISRAVSHLKDHHFTEKQARSWINQKEANSNSTYMTGYPVLNNMIIRQLLGRERYIDTTTPITQHDLDQAKQIVDQFNVFVPLEYMAHENVKQMLKREVPEYYQRFVEVGGKDFVRNEGSTFKSVETKEFLDLLAEENAYDRMLYDYMLKKLGIHDETPDTVVSDRML